MVIKKLISFLLVLTLVFSFCACNDTPNEPKEGEKTEHIHNYKVIQSKEADCKLPKRTKLKCETCGDEKIEYIGEPLEHLFTHGEAQNFGDYVECERDGCNYIKIKYNTELLDQLEYVSLSTYEPKIEQLYSNLLGIIQTANLMNNESSVDFETLYQDFEAKYQTFVTLGEEIDNMAYKAYLLKLLNNTVESNNNNVEAIHVNTFFKEKHSALIIAIYNSNLKEKFFNGYDNAEVEKIVKRAKINSNSELTKLKIKSEKIIADYVNLNDNSDAKFDEPYYELVENNKKIALLAGYDNYVDYVNNETYYRDNCAIDFDSLFEYAKQYLVPLKEQLLKRSIKYEAEDLTIKNALDSTLLFEDKNSFELVREFFGKVNLLYNKSNVSLLKIFDDAIKSGRVLFSNANIEVTYSEEWQAPLLIYDKDIKNIIAFSYPPIHEVGHYLNLALNSNVNLSMDICETQSMCMETLFLAFLKDKVKATTFNTIERFQNINIDDLLDDVLATKFERAVYLNEYQGINSQIIMADNKITKDEYAFLKDSLATELGILASYKTPLINSRLITTSGYLQSYIFGRINALQLYAIAKNEGLEKAVKVYSKLIDFTNVLDDWSYDNITKYAGLLPYNNQQAYINITSAFSD